MADNSSGFLFGQEVARLLQEQDSGGKILSLSWLPAEMGGEEKAYCCHSPESQCLSKV